MQSHTKNWQRVTIWVIAIAMAIGSLGFYFMIIMQNNDAQNASQSSTATDENLSQKEEGSVDTTAFKVEGKVTEFQKVDLVEGAGAEVKPGDTVRVHYKGTFAQSGVKFDSSYDRGEPSTFSLTGVIPAWSEGVPGMKVGGKRRIIAPSDVAYGATGTTGIPPNSDLVFEIELLAVNPPVEEEPTE